MCSQVMLCCWPGTTLGQIERELTEERGNFISDAFNGAFPLLFEDGVLRFYFALGPTN